MDFWRSLNRPSACLFIAHFHYYINSLNCAMNTMRTSKAAQAAERTALLSRIAQIRAEGEVLEGCRLNFSAAGGTASRSAKLSLKYAQLRSGRGKVLGNGKRSQYVALDDIPKVQAAIERGRELAKLQKRLKQLESQG
jgi:hypothetical protein